MRRNDPVRGEPNPASVLRFMDHLVDRAETSHQYLRETKSLPPFIKTALVSHIVQMLAALEEALDVLSEMLRRKIETRKTFRKDLKVWEEFRDDAAHVVSRMFREPSGRRHQAAYIRGTELEYAVLRYSDRDDSVSTGAEGGVSICIGDALRNARNLCEVSSKEVLK